MLKLLGLDVFAYRLSFRPPLDAFRDPDGSVRASPRPPVR